MKMNALVDGRCIRALYAASQAGVRVDLNVRGICCLRPGLPGISENIRVVSIVGRLLEHSRIYAFERDGEHTIYIASADLMPRNLDHRVELAVPIEAAELRAELLDTLERAFADNQNAWELDGEGDWRRRPVGPRRRAAQPAAGAGRAVRRARARRAPAGRAARGHDRVDCAQRRHGRNRAAGEHRAGDHGRHVADRSADAQQPLGRCATSGLGQRSLLEGKARFQRAAHRTCLRNPLESAPLVGRELGGQVQVDREPSRNAFRVVVHVDARLADFPATVVRVHRDHRRHARRQRRRQQLVRSRPLVASAQALGLVRDDRMAAVDVNLMLEAGPQAAGCGGHRHGGQSSAIEADERIRARLPEWIRRRCSYKYSSKQRCSCDSLFVDMSPTATNVPHPLPAPLVELIAERFRVLGEPMRIRLLDALREAPATVQELQQATGASQQNVSKHLGLLLRSGLVSRRKEGNFSLYAIADQGVFELCEQVCGGLRRQLDELDAALTGS